MKHTELALCVGIYRSTNQKAECEEHLDELERLCDTYGIEVGEKIACPIKKLDAGTFLGSGKIEELTQLIREKGITVVVFDDEISPHQQLNLEKLFGKAVVDRTEIILEVFAQRAQTREARLQIELAQTRYQLPRLKRLWTHLSRQAGGGGGSSGGGYTKGEGEKQIEIDRRLLRRRITQLEEELEMVIAQRATQRSGRLRSGIPTFAIIGYTNAGKSTLLRALTKADILVEDKFYQMDSRSF
jgi:GTP-binding protein HflX